jgi:hypothetical protein
MKKIYSHSQFICRGFQLNSFCIADNKKQASLILDVTMYCMNNWVSTIDLKKQYEHLEHGKIYYQFDQFGGEVRYFLDKKEIVKIYELDEIESIIKKHRLNFPTYHHTVEHYNK